MVSGWLELIEELDFDPTYIDLIVSYPHLNWRELLLSAVTVIAWRYLVDRLQTIAAFHLRRSLAWGLFRLAILVRP